jgi:hypothetical protein
MTSTRQGLKRSAGTIGFLLGVVLLSTSSTATAQNTAYGTGRLQNNTTGIKDSAFGFNALYSNTTGNNNTASGSYALYSSTIGYDNTASGAYALYTNSTGGNNIGLGYYAGYNIVAGSNNIEIGGAGSGDESNTIRIGTSGTQKATYIAGISAAQVTGNVRGRSEQQWTIRDRHVFGSLQARHSQYGWCERRFDEAAAGELSLQERPQWNIAARSGGIGSCTGISRVGDARP